MIGHYSTSHFQTNCFKKYDGMYHGVMLAMARESPPPRGVFASRARVMGAPPTQRRTASVPAAAAVAGQTAAQRAAAPPERQPCRRTAGSVGTTGTAESPHDTSIARTSSRARGGVFKHPRLARSVRAPSRRGLTAFTM